MHIYVITYILQERFHFASLQYTNTILFIFKYTVYTTIFVKHTYVYDWIRFFFLNEFFQTKFYLTVTDAMTTKQ